MARRFLGTFLPQATRTSRSFQRLLGSRTQYTGYTARRSDLSWMPYTHILLPDLDLVCSNDTITQRYSPSVFRLGLKLPASRTWEKRSEEHTSELQALMRRSYAVSGWKKKRATEPNRA